MGAPARDPRPSAPREFLAALPRLDDDGGADSARVLLREFLLERASTPDVVRACLDSCRAAFGEQSRRALQDIVLVAGRLLGFEVTFGRYARPEPHAPRLAGEWCWRGRLQVRVLVWSEPPADAPETIRRQVMEVAVRDAQTATLVLCVTTPTFGGTARVESALAGVADARLISLDALLVLATLVHQGVVRRDEALRELHPPVSLDERMALLTRLVDTAGVEDVARRFGVAPLPASCWVYVVRDGPAAPPGTDGAATTPGTLPIQRTAALQVRAGDVVCVLRHGTGLTLRAEVTGVIEDDADGDTTDPDAAGATPRFRMTLRRVRPLDPARPIGIDQQFDLEMQAAMSKGPLVWVTRGVFDGLVSD